jgi:hypothetical protein
LSLFIFFLPFSSFAKDKICHLGDKEIDGVPACGVKVAFFGPVSRRNFDFNLKTYPICERFGKKNIFEKYTFISTQGEKVGERLIPEGKLGKYEKCRDQAGDFYKKRFYMVGFKEKVIGTTLVFSEKVEIEDFKSYYKDFDFKKVEGDELKRFLKNLSELKNSLKRKEKRLYVKEIVKSINNELISIRLAKIKELIEIDIVESKVTKKVKYKTLGPSYYFVVQDYYFEYLSYQAYYLGEFKFKKINYKVFGGGYGKGEIKLFYKINNKIYVKTVRDINDHLTF